MKLIPFIDPLSDASCIKALLVDHLLQRKPSNENFLFGSELIYGKNKRALDLVLVNGSITGFEIKARNDDLRKVREQLDDYKKVFDYQFLVVTENHFEKASGLVRRNEGLIIVKDDLSIKIIKHPQIIKRQNKEDLLETIPIKYLRSKYNLPYSINAFEARSLLKARKIIDLKQTLKAYYVQLLSQRNKVFQSEKGLITHFEDIKLLSSNGSYICV